MSMPKGHKSQHGYATVSGIDGGLDYRSIALKMTDEGFRMNHATARNVFLRAMKKIAEPIHEMYAIDSSDTSLFVTAKDPRFQESVMEILEAVTDNEIEI